MTKEFTITFAGDTSLGDWYLKKPNRKNELERLNQNPFSFFEGVMPLVQSSDYFILNLETVLEEEPSGFIEGKQYPNYDNPERTLSVLKDLGVTAVSLANNHAMDFGPDVMMKTMDRLNDAEIKYFGAGKNSKEAAKSLKMELKGEKSNKNVHVITGMRSSKRYREDYGFLASKKEPGVNSLGLKRITNEIKRIRKNDSNAIIIVSPHWQGRDYKWVTPKLEERCRDFLEEGADFVFAHGTHMVNHIEKNQNGTIVYSMGNFIFNSPGRYKKMEAPPYSLIIKLNIVENDDEWIVEPLFYPIVTDNRLTNFNVRKVNKAESNELLNILSSKMINETQYNLESNKVNDEYYYKIVDTANSVISKNNYVSKANSSNFIIEDRTQNSKNILVGFMDVFKKPTLVATATAIMSAHYNIELVYLNPKDIDMEKGLIKGRQYRNNKWRPVTTKIPILIDAGSKTFNKSFNENTKEITNYLRKNTILTLDKKGTPNKERLQHLLYQDPKYAHIVIPSKKLNSIDLLEKFLIKYDSIILKPIHGRQGKGIYSLRKQAETYILSYGTEERKLNNTELIKFYEKYLVGKKYLIQKMINSRTNEGFPFDCRIVVQKNKKGKWVIGKMFFRIGTGQKVVSNTFQGGSVSDPKPFLKANYESKWNDIYKKLKEVALTLPYKFEEIKGTPTMDLGLDLGIDENGDLYLFEVNHGAAMKRLASISARLRLEYYQYLFDTHPELKKLITNKDNKKVKNQLKYEDVIHEIDLYKNKYHAIKNSKSWRLTMPLRKLSSYIKK